MTEPERCYLVCATQRSGSTFLCQRLKATHVAGRPEEYFEAVSHTGSPPHPREFLEGLPPTGVGIRRNPPPEAPWYSSLAGIDDYREHLTRTFEQGTTDNGVFGAKLMFNQLSELQALAGQLPEFAGLDQGELLQRLFNEPTYIWVSRGDKVRQAVSLWKALQNYSWRHDVRRGTEAELRYDFAGIDHLVQLFESYDRGWLELFAQHGIEPLAIRYERDLEDDPDGTVRAALDWIGVQAPDRLHVSDPMRRQADSLSEEWVAAYHRERAERGSLGALPASSQ